MSAATPGANYDFNQSLFLCKTMLGNIRSLQDRQRAVRWLRKLSTPPASADEVRLRNQYMHYMLVQLQNGELKDPFLQPPSQGPLSAVFPGGRGPPCSPKSPCTSAAGGGKSPIPDLDWLVDLDRSVGPVEVGEGGQIPLLYSKSPDGGAFLASQPIPRCGAFCYLAVVTKTPVGNKTSQLTNNSCTNKSFNKTKRENALPTTGALKFT